jgi:Lrp/AsnC family transcriptional regulator for asnA, asnC and gidA
VPDATKPRKAKRESLPKQLDSMDRDIVQILQVDGRTSNSEIARRLGVTETTVRKRLAALLEGDFIEIVAVPSPRLAGFSQSAIMGITTNLREMRQVAAAITACPEVRYCGVSTGRYNLIIEAFFADHSHLVEFTTDVLGQMPGVNDVETSLILTIEKFSADWQIDDSED